MRSEPIRIANGQGFWGDSVDAPAKLVRGGPIDYLTLDYLAEVTMSIMQRQKSKNPKTGYASDFVE
ncbi:MAG: acyclic terpene utilization AtuA family protein, partial [Candidatus Marinimicrobia bacterium]|nr:acyclic terpene utilization AtuA family protein [Candidatus Neomarinimicrobiota bacterium]